MENNGDQPPLIWPQFESTHRRSPVPTMLVPVIIGVISAAVFLLFTTFVVPPFLSVTSQILQPASVKRGWDSINVVLVLFAIICGVLARRNDDGPSSYSHSEEEEEQEGAMIGETVDDDRLKIYESLSRLPVTGGLPLRRSSSSYPDLRNGVLRETVDRRFRFYDDLGIDKYRGESTVLIDEQFQSRSKTEIGESETKEITVDKFVVIPSSPPSHPPQQPPAPPPNPPPLRRTNRSVRDMQERPKRSDTSSDSTRFKRTLRPPPSPPPPPPPPRKQGTLQRRKSNAAKEIKMVFASLYNQGKRKKKQKRKERSESPAVVEMEPPQYQSSIPPPPPPPPPPQPRSSQSVFYGLFKKGVKSKKIHSIPVPPPPPPPRRVNSSRPPRPTKQTNLNEESYQGSPLTQTTPPPPPPPPFRVPPLKFVVSGDFAKIRSNQSSRCSSPEREVIDLGWGLELTQSDGGEKSNVAVDGGGSGGMGFCPSPDVNAKADNFIARLRDEWRLDKVNSVKRRRSMSSF
ncbi:hypothetical protein N665_0769s0003 [Sinapis alba]|nr:hypothetical protein N665_0769s0003 [Sinapis alba]